jgi:hypothetical protein
VADDVDVTPAVHTPVLKESHKAQHTNNPTVGGMARAAGGLANTANLMSSQEAPQLALVALRSP